MTRNVEVYVEGYHDRAFIDGWLRHRGWQGRRGVVNPVTKKPVTGGRYGLTSPTGATFVEIVPVHGDAILLGHIGERVKRATPPDPDEIVLVLDADDPDPVAGTERRRQSLHDRLTRHEPGIEQHADHWLAPSGTRIRLMLWSCDDADGLGVPEHQTLERIVSTAIGRSYSDRAGAVQRWLDERPAAPPPNPKSYSWSYMAGWFPDRGCEAFLSGLWDDPTIAARLDELLRSCGAHATIESLESILDATEQASPRS